MLDDLAVSSHEQDGRVLSGVGASTDDLKAVMDRHTPEDAQADPIALHEPASDPAAPVAEPSEPPAKQTRGAKRFDQLTAEREAAKREADAAKRERDDLKARLAALETPRDTPREPARQEPSAFTFQPFDQWFAQNPGKEWDDWNDAKTAARTQFELSHLDLDARIRQSIEADRASRSFVDHLRSQDAEGRKVYADFDAVAYNGPGALVNMTKDRLDAIMLHPQSARVRYAVGQDAALAQRIATASPFQVGAILEQIAPSTAVASPASTAAGSSVVAPAPYQPVGSGSKTTVIPSAELPKRGYDFDKSGYREKRAAERGMRRR